MCGLRSLIFASRSHHNIMLQTKPGTTQRARHPGKSTRDQGPTNRSSSSSRHVLTRDFSAVTRHGSIRPDPHESHTSRITRSVAGRVGSGRGNRLSNLAGRVGSGDVQISRVGSGRVKMSQISRVGQGRVKTSRHFVGRVGSVDPTRPDL